MEFQASIANPEEYWWEMSHDGILWRFDFGAYGDLHIYVWGRPPGHEPLEQAAAHAVERGWEGIFEEPDLKEASEDLVAYGNLNPSQDEIEDQATSDLTYTESGYLGSDWYMSEIDPDSSEYSQIVIASQVAWINEEGVTDLVIDPEQVVFDEWAHGIHSYGILPFIASRLRPLCEYLLPVQLYPYFVTRLEVKRWVIVVACEQNQPDALGQLQELSDELNEWENLTASLTTAAREVEYWVRLADSEEHLRHEGEGQPQEHAPRVSAVLTVTNAQQAPIEVEFVFMERFYGPEFQEED